MANLLKLNPQQQKVLELLQHSEKPLSAYEVLDALRPAGMRSPPTIYRVLAFLLARGVIHRIESCNGFVACQHGAVPLDAGNAKEATLVIAPDHASLFALCTSCGKVESLVDDGLMGRLKKRGQHFLAKISKEVLELSGICHTCIEKAEP